LSLCGDGEFLSYQAGVACYERGLVAVTKQKGLQAEFFVAHLLSQHGFTALVPFGEDTRYDLVSEKRGVFKRIQVKFVAPKNGALQVQLRSANNYQTIHYSDADVDIIAAYNPENSKVYFIPLSGVDNKSTLNLRLSECKNGQQLRVIKAADYEFRFDILEESSAGVAQLVEHRTCNARVGGSSPFTGSIDI
jgi:PD-(D/E)XK nuclease superfamily protein